MAKIGENALGNMAKLGLEELRAAVTQQPQMPVEAPKPSHEQALASAARAVVRDQSRGIER